MLGYKGRVVGHGLRHTFSTILNDKGFNSDWVELQIAHVDKNNIRGVYNHALYMEELWSFVVYGDSGRVAYPAD